jgi:hypothetical protein
MASSSVSQEDFDNDYERLERRSRIRTARARQINPQQSCRLESNQERLPPIGIEIDDSLDHPFAVESVTVSPYSVMDGDTSPKPVTKHTSRESKNSSEKRPVKLMHHSNKGKQHRDRRKLREKRRSTGVVHLISTESTGGSTSDGEDEESSEPLGGGTSGVPLGAGGASGVPLGAGACGVSISAPSFDTKRNTLLNESAQDGQVVSPPVEVPERKNSGHKHHSPLYSRHRGRGDKSPRSEDLEADDEQGDKTDNDHDSLNLSESHSGNTLMTGTSALLAESAAITSSSSSPAIRPSSPSNIPNSSSTPALRSGTPTIPSTTSTPVQRPATPTSIETFGTAEDRDRCLEENKTLVSMMAEKDRRIQFLELKIQQLTLETQSIIEEQSRLREENANLVKTVGNISK